MPAYVIRIILLMGVIVFSSFAYEFNYSNKAIDVTGKIIAIKNKAKGKDIAVSLTGENQIQGVFWFSVGPVIDLIENYTVGSNIPIKYCKDCNPMVKIGDTANMYVLTLMILMLTGMVFIAFIIRWFKGKNT